ncbi:MAG: glycosyltransferase family 39 protein, partial [Salinivirgaceae bacterium]
LFSSSIFLRILLNQSDALFVTMSVMALGYIIRYRENSELKNIWLASLFVGLGVLSRVESILLVIPLVLFAFLFNTKRHKSHKIIFAGLAPLFMVLLSFIVINLLTFGQPKIGMGGKSYFSFTHPLVQNFLPGSKNHEAYLRGEPIFGTVEENNASIFKAILRNPLAVGERMLANILEMPEMLSSYFGDLHYLIFVFYSLLGIYALIKSHNTTLLLLLLVWPSHALITLIFESFHFIPQTSYLLLILSGIGITYIFSDQPEFLEKIYLFLFVVASIAIALLGQYKALFAFGALMFVVFLSNLLIENNNGTVARLKMLPIAILLAGTLLYVNNFTFPAKRLGKSESERAVYALQENFPKESNVIAHFPRPAVAAKMNHISFPGQIKNENDFVDYLIANKIVAVYVNDVFPFPSEFIHGEDFEYSNCIKVLHESESGDIRIYETDFSCE